MISAISDIRSGVAAWRIWVLLGYQDIQMRYRRSLIGPFWISISLITLIMTLAFLYSQIFGIPFKEYLSYLGIGLLAWYFLSALISEGCNAALESEAHLRNVPLPLSTVALRVVFRSTIVFLHNLLAVVVMLAAFGIDVGWTALLAIPAIGLYLVLGTLLALVLGPLCARYRDLQQIVTNATQIVFFLSPIMWQASQASGRAAFVDGNPFYHLVEIVRAPILGELPSGRSWLVSLAVVVVLAIVALAYIPQAKRRLYLWL